MATKKKTAARKGTPARAKRAPARRPQAKGRARAPASRKAPTRRPAPRRAAPPPTPAAPDLSRPVALAVAHAGLDKKAEDVTVFDVRGLSSYADYLVLMTADSDRQAGAIADHVDELMKKAGQRRLSVEGYETGRWIVADYGEVVAHVMSRESREFYDLEGLWADAPRVTVEG